MLIHAHPNKVPGKPIPDFHETFNINFSFVANVFSSTNIKFVCKTKINEQKSRKNKENRIKVFFTYI